MNKTKVLVIVGPTASGKSDLAVKLAKRFNGEVISADSRQVYKGLDIGTGKITKREMRGVPHHLLDVARLSNNSSKQFTVADYQRLAQEKIKDITARGKLPIICGGTGLYVDAALGRLSIPAVPPNLKLRKKLGNWSVEKLFKKLLALDPVRAGSIDARNPRRLIRAIEIAEAWTLSVKVTPTPSVQARPGVTTAATKFDAFWIGLKPEIRDLKSKIHERLNKRVKQGLIKEVRDLHEKQKISWRRLEELGLEYRYVSEHLRNKKVNFVALHPSTDGLRRVSKIDLLLLRLETAIWHYAKRQMTWFKREAEIRWLPEANAISKLIPQIKAWRSEPRLNNTGTIDQ